MIPQICADLYALLIKTDSELAVLILKPCPASSEPAVLTFQHCPAVLSGGEGRGKAEREGQVKGKAVN